MPISCTNNSLCYFSNRFFEQIKANVSFIALTSRFVCRFFISFSNTVWGHSKQNCKLHTDERPRVCPRVRARERETEKQTDRQRQTDRDRETGTDRDRDRDRHRERQRQSKESYSNAPRYGFGKRSRDTVCSKNNPIDM